MKSPSLDVLSLFHSHKAKQEALEILKRCGALDKHHHLKPNFKIGRIKQGKFLGWDTPHKTLSIKKKPAMLQEGDIVVLAFPSCKIVGVLESKQKFEVGYLTPNKRIKHILTGSTLNVKARSKELAPLPPFTIFALTPSGEIKHVLGHLSDPSVDESIVLALHSAFEPFSKQSLQEAQSFGDCIDSTLYPQRIDLRDLDFCTIDPDDAKDFDDAIFYDEANDELYVAIADVSEYVTPYSSLDAQAKKRGFSIYLPHKAIPMLPHALSENLCSLKPFEDRLAFVWKIALHHTTPDTKTATPFLALIRSKQRLTYTQASQILESHNSNTSIERMLKALFAKTKHIRHQRLQEGYEFSSKEERMILHEDLSFSHILTQAETHSHQLIEECMLLANVAAAQMLERNLTNGIYRSHASPKPERIIELFRYVQSLGYDSYLKPDLHASINALQEEARAKQQEQEIDRLIIKAQSQAQYTPTNQSHFGLGFLNYTHFTSPIRRYVDVCVHRILKSILNGQKPLHLIEDIQKVCDDANYLEKECAMAEIAFKDRIYARWASEHIGYILEAIVIDEAYPALARAKAPITGARLYIESDTLTPLQTIKVQIVHSDILQAKIICKLKANH